MALAVRRHAGFSDSPEGRLRPGELVGAVYRIERLVAVGGMGEVYEAIATSTGQRFALKVLTTASLGHPEGRRRFLREAAALALLHHPHIVRLEATVEAPDGAPALVMEWIEGCDLSAVIFREGPLCPARAAAVISQVGSALTCAHALGVVHRDLKPDNVLLVEPPCLGDHHPRPVHVKLVDFGICKFGGSGLLTQERSLMGTPAFMSPEQARGLVGATDELSDQFALSALAHYLLSGRDPFVGKDATAVLHHVVNGPPLPLPAPWAAPGTPLRAVLDRGMAKERRARFASVAEFARALAGAVDQLPVETRAIPSSLKSTDGTLSSPSTRLDPSDGGSGDGYRVSDLPTRSWTDATNP